MLVISEAGGGGRGLLQRDHHAAIPDELLHALHAGQRQRMDIGQDQDLVREIPDSDRAVRKVRMVQQHIVIDQIEIIAIGRG